MAQVGSGKQRQWLERVRLWQQSGLGVREFCGRHGLSEPSFFAWRRTLRQRGLIEDRPTKASKAVPAFVQVDMGAATDESATVSATSRIEIVLARGRRLRVRPGFDAQTLRQLLRLLEETSAC
jgi:transposase-like protein